MWRVLNSLSGKITVKALIMIISVVISGMEEQILYTPKERTNWGKRVVLGLTSVTRVDVLNYKYTFWQWPWETLLDTLSQSHEVWPGQKIVDEGQ